MAWIGFPLFYSSPPRPFLTCLTAKVLILRNQNGKKRHLKTYFGGYNVGGDTDVTTSLSAPFFVTGQMSLICTLQIGKESSGLLLSFKTNTFHGPLRN